LGSSAFNFAINSSSKVIAALVQSRQSRADRFLQLIDLGLKLPFLRVSLGDGLAGVLSGS
jgi:hypothetical protein